MALTRVFRAQDLVQYRHGPVEFPFGAHFFPEVEALGQVEEFAYITVAAPVGVVWARTDFAETDYTLFVLSKMHPINFPSWSINEWRFDPLTGQRFSYDDENESWSLSSALQDDPQPAHRIDFGTFNADLIDTVHVEPNGNLWWFGAAATAFNGGAIQLNAATYQPFGDPISPDDFLDPRGNPPIDIQDFAIDRNSDRLFVRWSTNNVGEVSIYRFSTREFITNIFAPNQTCGIVLTQDGFIYVADEQDWLCQYDYDGVFYGALRNTRRSEYLGGRGGFAYGWDSRYRRLLFLGGVPNEENGDSQLRVYGMFPTPDAALVTPPIPREVPRRGRRTMVFARIFGDGAEPISSTRVSVTGTAEQNASSDLDGDIVFAIEPENTDPYVVELSANANVTETSEEGI